ncbi:GNAT family N-acetyltransferase [Candidatus Brevifilum fermentans]|jgi:N-acetylglutamate synthase-like GNAT family acetyltransferase|uniref:N-acetyltransferase domain-containing protein n=1 Tax=Candidatus Brevifilum fermentans TaxID=1986204 RepID=A0A1Y6K3F0_9CHLR|nr:GNAT family N-acetyltransferase [Brevefilum fermentans]MDI9567031.1 GNAT family N-acetyltransferase [Chloroflexota bacterium]SMX54232.1 protein of unknown function [Brevefilum fermentans]
MIKTVKSSDKYKLISFIGNEYRDCPYLYANLIEYGLENPNMSMWTIEEKGATIAIVQKYFSCLHLFSKTDGWVSNELLSLINQEQPRTLFATKKSAEALLALLSDRYYLKIMNLYSLPSDTSPTLGNIPTEYLGRLKQAEIEDIDDIADFLMEDKEYKMNYDRNVLYNQLLERFSDNYSRYYLIKENARIIATISTKAEHPSFAVIGGVLVDDKYRGRSIGKSITYDLSKILQLEGKEMLCYISENNIASAVMFSQIGYNLIGETGKFTAL